MLEIRRRTLRLQRGQRVSGGSEPADPHPLLSPARARLEREVGGANAQQAGEQAEQLPVGRPLDRRRRDPDAERVTVETRHAGAPGAGHDVHAE